MKTSTRSTGKEDLEREAHVFMKLPARQKKFFFQVAEWTLKCCRHLNIVNLMGVCLPTDMHPLLLLELCEVFGLIPNVKSFEHMLTTDQRRQQ